MFFVVLSNDRFNFPLGLIKYTVVVVVTVVTPHDFFRTGSTIIIPQQRPPFSNSRPFSLQPGDAPKTMAPLSNRSYSHPTPHPHSPLHQRCQWIVNHTYQTLYTPHTGICMKGKGRHKSHWYDYTTEALMKLKDNSDERPGIPLLTPFSEMHTVCVHMCLLYHYSYFREKDLIVLREGEGETERDGKTERDLFVFYFKSMFECVLCLFYSNIILREAPRTYYITWICTI